jgi:sugar phosphate permease
MIAPEILRRFHRVRLLIYSVLAVSYMLVFFHRIAPGVVATDLMRAFDTTGAALGSLAAIYFYVYAAMQIPAGVLADTLGVRRAGAVGALLAGIGSIVFALAPNFATAAAGRFLVGLGVSVVFVGFMRANADWWSERRYGFISGLTVFLGNVGAILAASPLAVLLAHASWRTIFIVIGVFSILIAALTHLLVRDRPEHMGFPSLREMEGQPAHAPRSRHWWHDLLEVLRNREIWPGFFVSAGLGAGALALVGLWGVPLLIDVHGLPRAQASLYPTLMLATFAVGCLVFGVASDRLGRRKPVLMTACFATALTWLALVALHWGPGWSGLTLFGLLGFWTGGFIVTFGAAKEVVPPSIAGMGIAVVNTGSFLGAAVVQPAFGALLDLTWDGTIVDGVRKYSAGDYTNGLMLCYVLAVMAVVASFYLRETYCRNVTVADMRAGAPINGS